MGNERRGQEQFTSVATHAEAEKQLNSQWQKFREKCSKTEGVTPFCVKHPKLDKYFLRSI